MSRPLPSSPEATSATGLVHRIHVSDDASAPLAVLVHGRAGTSEVMWAFRRSIPESYSIITPQAFVSDPVGGFSWWEVQGDEPRDSARESTRLAINEARKRLSTFIDQAIDYYRLSPRCVVAFGFSQGAGLLSSVLQVEPQRFAGVGLLAGFVVREGEGNATRPHPPVLIAHGDADDVVPIEKARDGADFLKSRGFPVEFYSDPVGHKIGTTAMRALKEWVPRVVGDAAKS